MISFRWLLLALLFGPGSLFAAAWNIQTIDGRDAVPVEQVTGFYGLGPPVISGKSITAASGNSAIRLRIGSREAIINGVRHWLAFPVRNQDGSVWISRMDVTKTIDPIFRPAEVNGVRPLTTVVLDAGHGGHDKGASSPLGQEKEFVLDLAKRVKKRLEAAGLKVIMTRQSDVFIPLESRPAVASRTPGSIFVSLHFNDASWRPAATGIEVFCIPPLGTPPTGQEKPLARDLEAVPGHRLEPQNFVLANTVFHAMRGKFSSMDRGVKRARFKVLQLATVPAVLIEAGFLTNPAEAKQIASASWRDRMADAITAGILEYRKLCTQQTRPKQVADWGGKPTVEFVSED
jgi:N-acetylmuramoyl-L-alanine amidase